MRDGRSEMACVKMGAGRFSTRALLWFIGSYPSVIPALVTVRADSTAAEPLPWWRAKLEENRARDQRNDSKLRRLGWEPVHIWEHEYAEVAGAQIIDLWTRRTQGS